MGAIVWKKTEQDSWSGDEGATHLGVIDASSSTFHLTNAVGTELGNFGSLGEAQRQLVADRRAPERARPPIDPSIAPPVEDVLDIDTIAVDMARVRVDGRTTGFVRRVGKLFVALAGPTLHLAVEVGQFFSVSDAVKCIRSSPLS